VGYSYIGLMLETLSYNRIGGRLVRDGFREKHRLGKHHRDRQTKEQVRIRERPCGLLPRVELDATGSSIIRTAVHGFEQPDLLIADKIERPSCPKNPLMEN
jgi:hypothetical protein